MTARITGAKLNETLGLGVLHARYREDGKWYHPLKKFPGALFDENGYVIIQTSEEYLSNTQFQHGVDLHVIGGIASLNNYRRFSIEQIKLVLYIRKSLDEETLRVVRQVDVLIRNRKLVAAIKEKYGDACQICGIRLEIRKGIYYSEVHHIRPLGKPHNGPDRLENMICVCPNHHVLLDIGSLKISISYLSLKHDIDQEHISYHNEFICNGHYLT